MKSRPKLAFVLATMALLVALLGSTSSRAYAAPNQSFSLPESSAPLLHDGDDEDALEEMHEEDGDDEQDEDEKANASGSGMIISSIGIASAAVIALAFISQLVGQLFEKVRGRRKPD